MSTWGDTEIEWADEGDLLFWGPSIATLEGPLLRRHSEVYPAPVLNSRGKPVNWVPVTTRDIAGSFLLLFGGEDITNYRDVPTPMPSWRDEEPFGEVAMAIELPQITPFEPLPGWVVDGAIVELMLVDHETLTATVLFEGMYISEEASYQTDKGAVTLTVIGALYEADLYKKTPTFNDQRRTLPETAPDARDIGRLIADELDLRPNLHLADVSPIEGAPFQTGIISNDKGSFNELLTGYIQDLLSSAWAAVTLAPEERAYDVEVDPDGNYWIVGELGSIIPFGEARFYGSMYGVLLNERSSGLTRDPLGTGYWIAAEDGGVFSFNATFHGAATGLSSNPIIEIEAVPTGGGYWVCSTAGEVYSFGTAVHYGNATPASVIVDFVPTPTGLGYWMLEQGGAIQNFGDAEPLFADPAGEFVGMAPTATGLGMYVLNSNGQIYTAGDAVNLGNTPYPLNAQAEDIDATPSGLGYIVVARDGGIFTFGDAVYLGNGFDGGATPHQWTLNKRAGRVPELRVKDRITPHWSVHVGGRGVGVDLSRDRTMYANVFYGEGVGPDYCAWRNSKYPNFRPDASPVMTSSPYSVGMVHADIGIWHEEMRRKGHDVPTGNTFTQQSSTVARRVQTDAGITVTGTLTAQLWTVSFNVGSNVGDLTNTYIAPLVADPKVVPFLYDAAGSVIGPNPEWDELAIRVERYENFGENVSREQARHWALAEMARDRNPALVGTIKLSSDPEEGSRFLMKAGHNIVLRGYRGSDVKLHIAAVERDPEDLTVTLTVDESARDRMTVAAILDRDRGTIEAGMRDQVRHRNSRLVEDRIAVWDCESGAGYIPRHLVTSAEWSILRIPAGEYGEIVTAEFYLDTPARFSVGVFDRAITAAQMEERGVSPLDEGYWDLFDLTEERTDGLLIAWGGSGNAWGFWPGQENSEADPLTGKGIDRGSWTYSSTQPPWLWVAMWVESPASNYIRGRLQPGRP